MYVHNYVQVIVIRIAPLANTLRELSSREYCCFCSVFVAPFSFNPLWVVCFLIF